ncbi:hypothetical protein CRE_22343 [Caenorhabditis remanei]|uniref:Uncharacterized protein n=1 Tax=Caenorhabditis remanei TaxID=31234 RepID=E3ME84_CAERE|nr:hypothetical protein CRE_22343 [Caenorhabditis remanei]
MTPEPTKLPELLLSHHTEPTELDENMECGVCNTEVKKNSFLEHLECCAAGTKIPHLMMNVFFLEEEVIARDDILEKNFLHLINDEPLELRNQNCLYCSNADMHADGLCRNVKRTHFLGGMFQNSANEYFDMIKLIHSLKNHATVLMLKLQQKRKMDRIILLLQVVFRIENAENLMECLPADAIEVLKKIERKDTEAVKKMRLELRKIAEEELNFSELARNLCLEEMVKELLTMDIKNPRISPFEFVNTA